MHFDQMGYAELLADWIAFSQRHLYEVPGEEGLICYGPGSHGHWGVHTHQKAFSAFAVAGMCEGIDWRSRGLTREKVLSQALAMLRYNLHSHLSGDKNCVDGQQWGHSWIYVLGIERMMHGVETLDALLTPEDRTMLKAMLLSESDFLLCEYPVQAGLVEKNKPESNIWNGATLLRTAMMYPDCPNGAAYIEKAERFFANGISVESDETSEDVCDGRRIRDLFVGANFFDSYGCNHHHYMNVGYMNICLSNLAMLHFSARYHGWKLPEIVYRHARELWKLVRTMTYADGRLLRIGGDSRARYCYCQDYALPVWALAEDLWGEDCSGLEAGWLRILQKETRANGDGSFLSERFGDFEDLSPLYYTRLESDRANVISMALCWHARHDLAALKTPETLRAWHDAYHGAAFVSSEKRYASFVWRASEKPQGLCLPPDESSLAEWRYNLAGRIEGTGVVNDEAVKTHVEQMFPGGFITYGCTQVFSDQFFAEGQTREEIADKTIAFAALPDGETVLCLQYATALNHVYGTARGVMWHVPNDIFNGCTRFFHSQAGAFALSGGRRNQGARRISLGSWANVDDKLGLACTRPMEIHHPDRRQIMIKGRPDSGTLYAEEICTPDIIRRRWFDKDEVLLDVGFAMRPADHTDTEALSETLLTQLEGVGANVRVLSVSGKDGKHYALLLNVGDAPESLAACGQLQAISGLDLPQTLAPGMAALAEVR